MNKLCPLSHHAIVYLKPKQLDCMWKCIVLFLECHTRDSAELAVNKNKQREVVQCSDPSIRSCWILSRSPWNTCNFFYFQPFALVVVNWIKCQVIWMWVGQAFTSLLFFLLIPTVLWRADHKSMLLICWWSPSRISSWNINKSLLI